MQEAQEHQALIEEYVAAWNHGDMERARSYVADDCEYVCGMGLTRYGKEGFDDAWLKMHEVMSCRIELDGVTASGDTVVVQTIKHVQPTAQVRADSPGLPDEFEMRHVDVLQIRDGKVVRGRTYTSTESAEVEGHALSSPMGIYFLQMHWSDARLKRRIARLEGGLERLRRIESRP